MTQADPRHVRARELLLQAGQRGTDLRQLARWLGQENRYATEDTVRGWLDTDAAAGLVTAEASQGGTKWRWTAPEPPARCNRPVDVTR